MVLVRSLELFEPPPEGPVLDQQPLEHPGAFLAARLG